MLLGFKRRFAPYVEDGSKTHTIRATANGAAGRRDLPLLCRSQAEDMRLPRQMAVRAVEEITVSGGWESRSGEFFGDMHINGVRLDHDERNALAWRDGFRSLGRDRAFEEMMEFWRGRLRSSAR